MRSRQRMMRELAPGRTRPALPEEPRGGPRYGRGGLESAAQFSKWIHDGLQKAHRQAERRHLGFQNRLRTNRSTETRRVIPRRYANDSG